ncbi:hypothetical protein Bpfe_029671, partial [Biomphalaria pfeifferi]
VSLWFVRVVCTLDNRVDDPELEDGGGLTCHGIAPIAVSVRDDITTHVLCAPLSTCTR